MLDTATKRRIDTARDILVGKVPDPKSQVEQITIALIYKFMDDIDAESEELGGQRKYFSGDFARYGWPRLVRAGLGGHETLSLYAEAIIRMPENPAIPPLFRNIFNNAYLPYRDPETLRAFLKIIDEFNYDHSERLGDAFEYLLSVLGSQGDAGQFRTPRHIIDFIVAVIDPKKDETVLDPACGTAGFLISAYKHILRENLDLQGGQDNGGNPVSGPSMLTPDEKGKLATSFKGYDISPDMVRLSLVNLYLHGFVAPQIHEYDTLTSEERWNEYADVILANPPFMSPKGGIRPHNRFSVQSKRSEVLFVDYMAEHLTPGGRAGIIVPEGIIFQSQNAYRQLRKMLVENYLVAVISLPSGVFKPYSGVKTSILILDRALAKKSNRIAFFKVENDGFDLGDQRREIAKNDLPRVKAEIAEYLGRLRVGEPVDGFEPAPTDQVSEPGADYTTTLGLVAGKEKIAEGGEYNLSGQRYNQQVRQYHAKWQTVMLGEICSFLTGGTPKSTVVEYYENGTVPWLVSGDIHKMEIQDCERRITEEGVENSNAKYLLKDSVLIALNGQGKTRGTVAMLRMEKATCNQSLASIAPLDDQRSVSEFIFWILRSMYSDIRALTGDNERSGLNISLLKSLRIPLPPLEVQREIVAEIEGYQRVIDGARAVTDNYRPQIVIDPEWPIVKLGELTKAEYGFTAKASDHGDTRFIRITDIAEDGTLRKEAPKYITLTSEILRSLLAKGDILVARTGATYGKTLLFEEDYPAVFASYLIRLQFSPDVVCPRYYWIFAQSDAYWNQAKAFVTGGGQAQFNGNALKQVSVPLPSIAQQQSIVAEIEAEQTLVAANRELIERFEKKIRTAVERIWNTDASKTTKE